MSRIVITGGGGYLGTQVVRALLADPAHRLTVLDRFDWGCRALCSAIGAEGARVRVLQGDVAVGATVADALDGADAIIHLAAIVGYPACDGAPADANRTNVEGTRKVCRHAAGRPLLFASTGSTYGQVAGVATEATPLSPLTRYGRTKAEGERIVASAGGISFRFATLYGLSDRMRWDLLPHTLAREAIEHRRLRVYEPLAGRTFLHVADAAQAIRCALASWPQSPAVYNVGHAAGNLTKGAVAGLVAAQARCPIESAQGHDPDQRDYAVSFARIAADLPAWQPRRTLADTLPEILTWARVWR